MVGLQFGVPTPWRDFGYWILEQYEYDDQCDQYKQDEQYERNTCYEQYKQNKLYEQYTQ